MAMQVTAKRNWIQSFGDLYDEAVLKKAHPTVMNWTLVGQDWLPLLIVFSYVYFINYLGPFLMKNRKPFDLRWLMVPYNVALVIFNFYIFFEYAKIWLTLKEKVKCETRFVLDRKENPQMYRLAEITWYFYISKYFELFDTVFFVLRKKERQLSRLHKIHHSIVPILIGLMLRAETGDYNIFFPMANSFVHCIMYAYYGVSALGDGVTIHLKFKKYITMTQMIQFILVIHHFTRRRFSGCISNPYTFFTNLLVAGFFFVLFCNFYMHEYIKGEKKIEENGDVKQKEE